MVFYGHLEKTLHRVGCQDKTTGKALTALLSHHGLPPTAQGPQDRLYRPLGGRSSCLGQVICYVLTGQYLDRQPLPSAARRRDAASSFNARLQDELVIGEFFYSLY